LGESNGNRDGESMPIILILGGFHLLMSYLGSIGTLMKVSGLSEAFQTIYSRNAVEYMMSGKSTSRVIRGHRLVESVLTAKLLRQFISVDLIENKDGIDENDNDASENLTTETLDEYVEEETDEDEVEDESVEADDCMTDFDKYTFYAVDIGKLTNSILDYPSAAVVRAANLEELNVLQEGIQQLKHKLSQSSRTAKLWIHDRQYIAVLKLYVRAERTGN
jgi:hypothetical protein